MLDGDPCEEIVFNDFDGKHDDGDWEMETLHPVLFHSDGIDISADYDWGCYHISTSKYNVTWYWGGNTFSIYEPSTKRLYEVYLKGNLDRFFECQFSKEEDFEIDYSFPRITRVLSASAEKFDSFVDRVWNLKAFS